MSEKPDQVLVEKAREELPYRTHAYEALMARHYSRIYNLCFRLSANTQDAEDITQEVMIKVFHNLKAFNMECKFTTWLYRIVNNTFLDHVRKQKKHRDNIEITEDHDFEDDSQNLDGERHFKQLISYLNDREKMIVVYKITLGHTFEEIAQLLALVSNPERLGVCLDTCHLLAAGYDLRTPDSYEETISRFDELIGLSRLKVWHFNDSKKGLASRVDRHTHIGEGELGLEPFRLILNDPRFSDLPGLLETPKGPDMHEDVENLKRLRQLLQEA
ncbi:MAG: deoxyribonuclease IV [Gammaproteobacteria bacterium]|nr:MAG: deoxyribonuclease IV [Gammaproteobacteria bacterium]